VTFRPPAFGHLHPAVEGSYAIGREHEEFLARVSAWVEETSGSRPRPAAVRRSPARTFALAAATVAVALAAAAAATPLDGVTRGWSLGLGPFVAGVLAGTCALRLGSRRAEIVSAAAAALCFAAMLVAVVVATVRV
jgi:hypothetical protein